MTDAAPVPEEPQAEAPGRPAAAGSPTRGFLFADLREYTRYVEEHGAAAAASLLVRYRTLVRSVVAAHDGAEIKTEGDSFYVVFPSVSAAVSCGLAITAATLPGEPGEGIAVGLALGFVELLRVRQKITTQQIGAWLVDIHGPHEHQSLLNPARQLAILHVWDVPFRGQAHLGRAFAIKAQGLFAAPVEEQVGLHDPGVFAGVHCVLLVQVIVVQSNHVTRATAPAQTDDERPPRRRTGSRRPSTTPSAAASSRRPSAIGAPADPPMRLFRVTRKSAARSA